MKLIAAALLALTASAQTPDWPKVNEEAMRHFQAVLKIDSSTGNETPVVDYIRKVLEAEGIPVTVGGREPGRMNLIARLKGNGSKKPLLVMGHTDTVRVDPAKWTHPPFSATRADGYVYGRGAVDDKDNVVAALMVMLLLKRMNI